MSLSRMFARPLIAAGILYGAQNALRHTDDLAPKAAAVTDKVVPAAKKAVPQARVIPDDPATLVRINAGVQIAASLALATGRAPRLSAGLLTASLVPTTIAGHAFWAESDPDAKRTQQMAFFKNLSIIGGLLITSGDTDGRPGVAWRARRAGKDARREATHLASAAKHEARLARAKSPIG
ncbi:MULTISPECIES: DoxX family protein [Nocardioides]|uniref:Membrane protein YphA (DoxX/SURF4 family) n=1 Tax=Nocardioides salarius TaxID=374513 RepID=A0ABS2MEZ6_9ACTN|nr:DoxX family membrane protein [Nocardioides salarius]MBM7509770.1 putative membrane protein YphA (DoxX/SURF4 family) [Nocardioides salarius]